MSKLSISLQHLNRIEIMNKRAKALQHNLSFNDTTKRVQLNRKLRSNKRSSAPRVTTIYVKTRSTRDSRSRTLLTLYDLRFQLGHEKARIYSVASSIVKL